MVITCAGTGVVWTRNCASTSIPPLAAVATTSRRDAPGATVPARTTSSVASPCSLVEVVPPWRGSVGRTWVNTSERGGNDFGWIGEGGTGQSAEVTEIGEIGA